MRLDWIQDKDRRSKTRHSIDHNGLFTLSYCESDILSGHSELKVEVQSYQCKDMKKPEKNEVMKTDQTDIEEMFIKDMKFVVDTDGEERAQKINVLNKKINALNKRHELQIASKKDYWKLNQLINRRSQMEAVWITTNHIIVKSGANLKYASKKTKDVSKEKFDSINIDFGTEVWI